MSFSKINIGLRPNGTNKKAKFDLSCDSHFSTNFGRIVPIYTHEFPAGSHVSMKIDSLVRMSPLSVPTEGRMSLHYYHCFVPYKELWKPFDALLANQPYNFVNGSSIPTKVPTANYRAIVQHMVDGDSSIDNTSHNCASNFYLLVDDSSLSTDVIKQSVSNVLSDISRDFIITPETYCKVVQRDNDSPLYCHYDFNDDRITWLPSSSVEIVIFPTDTSYDEYHRQYDSSSHVIDVFQRFGSHHRNVLQKLVGLGYPYNATYENFDVSILPLMAFWYSWFKLFGIERTVNINSTNYSKLKAKLISTNNVSFGSEFIQFLHDLNHCYYTFAPDYFTSQVLNMADNQGSSTLTSQINLNDSKSVLSHTDYGSRALSSDSSLQQTIARRLLRFVNINTVVGQSIEKYLRSLYPGITFDKKHDVYVGSSRVNVGVEDIYNMAESDNAVLGDFAGRGKGSGSSSNISFDTQYHGIWITFGCLVPQPGYYQAYNPLVTRSSRFDFFNPEFDSMGYVPTTRFEFISDKPGSVGNSDVIGLRPRYMDYKIHNNVITGCLRQESEDLSYRGYYLDRTFTDFNGNLANPNLRILSENDHFNLNRIFSDSNNYDDHFLVFNLVHCNAHMPMIPISDSYVDSDTDKAGNVSVSRS